MSSNHFEAYFIAKLVCFLTICYVYGFLTALTVSLVYSFTVFFTLWLIWGYKPLMGAELAFYANRQRPANVIGVMHVEGRNMDEIIPLLKKIPYCPGNVRMQCRVDAILGENFWSQPIKNLDLDKHIHIIHKDFQNYQDIADFSASIIDSPLPSDRPLWEAYVADSYKQKDLVIFFKVNHCLTDGLSAINCIVGNMADDYKGLVHRLPVIPWTRKLLTLIVMPIYSIYLLAKLVTSRKDANMFSQRQVLGTNVVTVAKKIKLSTLKTTAKTINVTINDLLTAGTLFAIKRFMNQYSPQGMDNGEQIRAGFPMIMKENTNGLRAISLEPKLTILYIDLPLPRETDKLSTSFINSVRNVLTNLKGSFEPLIAYYISTYLLPLLPFPVVGVVLCHLADKMSFIFSNMAGCPEKLHIAKRKVKSMYCIPPNYAGIPFCMTVTSYGEDVRTLCMSNQLDKEKLGTMMDQIYDALNGK